MVDKLGLSSAKLKAQLARPAVKAWSIQLSLKMSKLFLNKVEFVDQLFFNPHFFWGGHKIFNPFSCPFR